jgi:hypothetical protein
MKLFTVEEANTMLPQVKDLLFAVQHHYAVVDSLRVAARAAAAASDLGGGMTGGTNYVKALYEVGKITTELNDAGVQLKDHTSGLVDFPSLIKGRIVFLCWQLGEGDRIEWWHEVEDGFAGRKRLLTDD